MRRCILLCGMLFWTAALMAADFKASPLQRDMVELLDSNFGMVLVPNPEMGEECSFVVTEDAIKAMKALQLGSVPVVISNANAQATKKSDIFKAMGFIPRKSDPNDQDAFKLDVTDVTIQTLRGKTVIILADGTVKFKATK
jgi:hypothetical protein